MLILPLDGLGKALLGILEALAPFCLLARGRAEALAIGSTFSCPCRCLGPLLGHSVSSARRVAPLLFQLLLESRWIGQSGKRALGRGHGIA